MKLPSEKIEDMILEHITLLDKVIRIGGWTKGIKRQESRILEQIISILDEQHKEIQKLKENL